MRVITEGKLNVKGVVEQDIYGSFEGALEGGSYTQLSVMINFTRLGDDVYNGKLYLSGSAGYTNHESYSAVSVETRQSNIVGQMSGYYAGPFNAMMSSLVLGGSPYAGEGYAFATYTTSSGEAQGWTYVKEVASGVRSLKGVLNSPLYGLITGALNTNVSPPTSTLFTDKLDNSALGLRIRPTGPDRISPGETVTYGIRVKNEGSLLVENVSVIFIAPMYMDYVSASGIHVYHNFSEWKEEKYTPVPFVRWDVAQLQPLQGLQYEIQLKMRVGEADNGEGLSGSIHIIPSSVADEVFPQYDPEGGHD